MEKFQPRTTAAPLARVGQRALIERWFPYREISQIAEIDRRAKDPKYSAHPWWARRPPGVFRGVLLGAALKSTLTPEKFWELFASDAPTLAGLTVEDPFAGGGTTVMEASRLGAGVVASDIDPLSVEIVRHQLSILSTHGLQEAGAALFEHLKKKAGTYFGSTRSGWLPLHYFYLRKVRCPSCDTEAPLYRDLIIARDRGKHGSVVRDFSILAFCPDCLGLHPLSSLDRTEIQCCGKRHKLSRGTFHRGAFHCPVCHERSLNRTLKTGTAPRILLAIEETRTQPDGVRRFRSPARSDHALLDKAAADVRLHARRLKIPETTFAVVRRDARPRSFGIHKHRELFSDRQLVFFGHAFKWLHDAELSKPVKRAMTLAVSSALSTNNVLCGYARDYGRLAQLFSIKHYALPVLSVELNPLHPFAGRGSLARTLTRVYQSSSEAAGRYIWDFAGEKVVKKRLTFDRKKTGQRVFLGSAERTLKGKKSDLCVFDPPYFDYIAYDELSDFYRSWHGLRRLGGAPLLPDDVDPVGSFSDRLARCLVGISSRVASGRPMIFTFHSTSADAWKAIGNALDRARIFATALWPVKCDVHMGHHSKPGNCEWDIVVVCRRARECAPVRCALAVEGWLANLPDVSVGEADKEGMRLAIEMVQMRFGRLNTGRRQDEL